MTNEEVIRNMTIDELGAFLCSLTTKCEYCELKDLCRTKYQKGIHDWLIDECKGSIFAGFWSVENLPNCSLNRDFTPFTSLCEKTWKDKREELTKQIDKWLREGNHISRSSIKQKEEIEKLLSNINSDISQEEIKRVSDEFDKIHTVKLRDKLKMNFLKFIKRK